jgi:hypothetical protein
LTYTSGIAKSFIITPFTVSVTCDTLSPVMTYSGQNWLTGAALGVTDFISVSGTTINVSILGTVGTTYINVIGKVLSNGQKANL